MKVVVAISGGSGAIYALRLLEVLAEADVEIHLVSSESGAIVFEQELGLGKGGAPSTLYDALEAHLAKGNPGTRLVAYDNRNPGSAIASGSFVNDGMVIVPCSMSMLAAINAGLAGDLISRAASVMLKEGRTLAVVPREMPLNEIHLRNMLDLCRAGVRILPPMPGFYHKPKTIDDLVAFVTGRITDSLGLKMDNLYERWSGLDDSE